MKALTNGTPEAMARAPWRVLGRPSSLRASVPIAAAPVQFAGPLLVDPARLGGSVAAWFAVACLGQAAVMAIIAVGGRLVRRSSRDDSRPVATLVVLLVSVVSRGLVVGFAGVALGLASSPEIGYRTLGSVPLIGGALVVSALVISARDEHRALVAELGAQRLALELLDATAHGRLAEIRERMLRQVRTTLEPALRDLAAAIDAVGRGSDASVELLRLRAFVDHDVRQLSRFILETTEPVAADAAPPAPGHTRWPSVLRLSMCLKPAAQGAVVGVVALGSATRDLPVGGAFLYTVVLGLVTFATLWLVRAALRSVTLRLPWAVLIAGVLGALTTWTAVHAVALSGLPSPRFLDAAAVVVGGGLAVALALYAALESVRSRTEEELAASLEAERSAVSALQRQTWLARQRLSILLHGTVQGAIHAAVLRLGLPGADDPERLAAVRRDVENSLARLDVTAPDAADLMRTLQELADTWDGVCAVTWDVSPGAQSLLARDRDCCECAAEVAREAVHNSIVHGGAAAVVVSVTSDADRLIVSVKDDGTGTDGAPGLGSRMLDDLCLRWSRTSTDDGTLLTAELVLA